MPRHRRGGDVGPAGVAPSDNTVLVLGKGHETGQDIGGTVHPFDDRDALRAALDGHAVPTGSHA